MRGRYLSLQLVVDGCQSTLPSAFQARFPRTSMGRRGRTGTRSRLSSRSASPPSSRRREIGCWRSGSRTRTNGRAEFWSRASPDPPATRCGLRNRSTSTLPSTPPALYPSSLARNSGWKSRSRPRALRALSNWLSRMAPTGSRWHSNRLKKNFPERGSPRATWAIGTGGAAPGKESFRAKGGFLGQNGGKKGAKSAVFCNLVVNM